MAWGALKTFSRECLPGNFDLFLHVMLFYHTRNIIGKQRDHEGDSNDDDDDDNDEGSDGELD